MGQDQFGVQMRELAEIVREVVPGSSIEYAQDAGPDKRCYRVDFSKVGRHLPGFETRWNARTGAEQLYQALRANGFSATDLTSGRYTRLGHIQRLLRAGELDVSLRWSRQAEAAEAVSASRQ